MKAHNLINRYTLLSALLCLGSINSSPAAATGLALSDTPLFLTQSAEANVFYLFDDSTSMLSEAITPDAVSRYIGTEIADGGTYYRYVFGSGFNTAGTSISINGSNVAPSTVNKARAPEYNSLYYNPNIKYEPWPVIPYDVNVPSGTVASPADDHMQAYPATAAPINPMDPTHNLVDLTKAWPKPENANQTYNPMVYYTWDKSTNTTTGPTLITSAADQQNFSNWFTYHRSREYAAKYALAKTIRDVPLGTRLRMGFYTINNQDKKKMASVTSKVLDAATDTGAQNRATIIDAVYGVPVTTQPVLSTPLRAAFQQAGNYFACDGNPNPWDSNPSTCALQKALVSPNDSEPPAACQQNFMVVMTDGVDDASYSADTGRSNADNDADTDFDQGAYDTNTSTYAAGPYSSSTTNGMADLGMYYYETDLDTNIDNKVSTECGVDENSAQHLVTYAMSFGLAPTVSAPSTHPQLNIAPDNCPATTVTAPSSGWQDNFGSATTTSAILTSKTNDLLHAAYNGRGNYYSATQPDQMVQDLQDVLSNIASRRGAASTVGFSSTSNDAGTLAYFSSFNSGSWYGELNAYAFDASGNLSTTLTWSANNILDALTDADVTGTGRTIITSSRRQDTTDGYGRPFRWSNLDAAQQLDLSTAKDGTVETTNGFPIAHERLDYIRGDHSCETGSTTVSSCSISGGFRQRKKGANYTRVGDMINSSPIYVGQAIGNYPSTAPFPSTSGTTYQDFKDGTATNAAFATTTVNSTNRTPMLYIGGNDGMLHVFRADATSNGGKEIFAFIPTALSPATASTTTGLHKLTETSGHHAYVDLTPSIADAYTATPSDGNKKWRTVLVGGLRSGGKGVFALDVTDPDSVINTAPAAKEDTASKKVMWEFTAADDPDLGYTYSDPVIVPLRVGSGSTTSDIAWFAVFGNGYNNSGSGHAVLFLVKLSGPTGGTPTNRQWVLGTDYYKIDTDVGTTLTPNGLSSPAVIDNNGDGIYDRVYAGDLQGNMWAFDLDKTYATDWVSAYDNGATPTATPKPLFTATNLAGTVEPITSKPLVIRNKAGGSSSFPNVLVLFGTGSYIAEGDEANTDGQTYYGVWDHGTHDLTRSDLVAKYLLNSSTTDYRVIDPNISNVPNYTGTPSDNGWYLDLPDSGERVVSKSFLVGGTVFFSSIIPSTSPCSGGGSSWLMAVDPLTGKSPGINTFDYNHDGVIDSADIPTLASSNNTQLAGVKVTSMVPQYSFLVSSTATPGTGPCSNGTAVLGIGTTTQAGIESRTLCTGGSAAKAGRYSWRQLDFN